MLDINIDIEKLTMEDIEWLEDRIDEAPSGRLIIKTHLINKYRKITGDYTSENRFIRSRIINIINQVNR